MTHIIGKPPAPKRGATFADVPEEGVFLWAGHRWVRLAPGRDLNGVQRNARRISRHGDLTWFDDGEPVTLLDVTPRDPEPDPAVTTYGELEPGGRYLNLDSSYECDILLAKTPRGPVGVDGRNRPMPPASLPVRRVPTSVVVHEEPGSYVERSLGSAQVFRVLCPAENRHITVLDRELQRIVQQGAALLAQQDAKPKAVLADAQLGPAPGWVVVEGEHGGWDCVDQTGAVCFSHEHRNTAARWTHEASCPVDGLVDGGDGHGHCPVCDSEQEGYPCLHPASEVAATKGPEADPLVQRLAKDPEALKRFNEAKPKAAEDRSKPAPGWALVYGIGSWCIAGPSGTHAGFSSPAHAIAWAWTQHDAQQAAPRSAAESPNTPEPAPQPGSGPAVWDLVIADMRERDEGGLAKYGTRLQAGNGRNALVDAYQEALDLAVYLRQRIAEDDAQQAGEGGESC